MERIKILEKVNRTPFCRHAIKRILQEVETRYLKKAVTFFAKESQ